MKLYTGYGDSDGEDEIISGIKRQWGVVRATRARGDDVYYPGMRFCIRAPFPES